MKSIFCVFLLLVTSIGSSQTLNEKWVQCKNTNCKVLDPYYEDNVSFTWEGQCKDGKANGFGKAVKFEDSKLHSTYEGEYVNGVRQGKGRYVNHINNRVWDGQFFNGQCTGIAKYTFDDGYKYEGNLVNYIIHGNGTLSYPNGAKFEGFFVNQVPYTGKFTNYDGKVTYLQGGSPTSKIKEEKSNYRPKLNEEVTEYFNENWERCEPKNAAYFRKVIYQAENRPTGKIKDYFITGQLQSEFYCVYLDYNDENKNFHEGEATWYYKNGKVEQKRFYYNNSINGKNTFWYENGQKEKELNYDHGRLDGYYYMWYKSGNLAIKAFYEKGELADDRYLEFDENGIGSTVYKERFAKNKNSWEVKLDGSESNIDVQKNFVYLKNKENKTTSRFNYISFNQTNDYSIETIIDRRDIDKNSGTGLLFGFKDWDNYYQFLISGNGSYYISGRFQGINISIRNWTPTNAINTAKTNQRNLLKVLKLGNDFLFSINGQLVAKETAKSLSGNNVGIICGGKGDIILETITIKEFTVDNSVAENTKRKPESDEWNGNGSGFFISEKGYIATNYHVVKDASEIQVVFFQNGIKKSYKAKVVKSDKQNDLSIIKIDDPSFKDLPKIPYNFSTTIADVGTSVFALGYPMALTIMGDEIKFTDGKISSKTGFQGDITVYQISVPIQPGNSGGPLFDSDGNLVGVTSSGLRKDISENVNYAIKATYLKNLIDVLPEKISLPSDTKISTKTLTDKIKILSEYIPLIKIK